MLTDFVFVCFWKKKKQSQLYLLKLLKLVNQNMTKFLTNVLNFYMTSEEMG